MLRVTGDLPEIQVKDVGSHDFFVSSLPVLILNESHQLIVNPCTMRQPETASRGQIVKEKQILFRSENSIITFSLIFMHEKV